MRIESWVGAAVVLLTVYGGIVRVDAEQARPFAIPANIKLLHDIELAMQSIYERSPSFRTQLARIADAPQLRVTIQIDPSIPGRCRAFTRMHRRGRTIRAEVHIPPSSDHAELLAHELEHILEQIEGLDLYALAQIRNSGVWALDDAVFETDRAQAAGRTVQAETRRKRSPAAD
jgi:hypothetical protein